MTASSSATALLLLADGRLPAGGHAHSGGLEPAVADGSVRHLEDLAAFLTGRLATTGLVAAAFAAATHDATATATATTVPRDAVAAPTAGGWPAGVTAVLVELEAELDARTPSPAQRAASRAQGRALLRAARAAWPPVPCPVVAPHHPVALGLAARAAGLHAAVAATIAAYHSVTGPAAAATRLLGLDPFGVTGVLARLGPAVDEVGARGARAAREAAPADLPAPGAVRLDVLAEQHRAAEIRLFAS